MSKHLFEGRTRCCAGGILAIALLSISTPARAAFTSLAIDNSLSSLTISGDIAGVLPLLEQSPGSLTAFITGTVDIDYIAGSGFSILGSSLTPLVNPGPFLPGNAPADFAVTVPDIIGSVDAFGAIRNSNASIGGSFTTDASGDFDATGANVGFNSGTFEYDLSPIAAGSEDLSSVAGSNGSATGNLAEVGSDLVLSFPVNVSALLSTDLGFSVNVNVTGNIVATGLIPPPPVPCTIDDATGQFRAGIDELGNVYCPTDAVGLQRLSDGYDPIAPGTPREAWGISANGVSGVVDPQSGGSFNVVGNGPSTFNANDAEVLTALDAGAGSLLEVDQDYTFAAPNVLAIDVTITNVSGADQDVQYSRQVDWDIDPTRFSETTTVYPYSNPIIAAAFNGFESANPLVLPGSFVGPAGGTFGPGDNGGGFILDFGTLADGESITFTIYQALSQLGQSESDLASQLFLLGAQGVITGTDSLDGSNSAALGVRLVPEPSSFVLACLAAFGLAVVRRRRRG